MFRVDLLSASLSGMMMAISVAAMREGFLADAIVFLVVALALGLAAHLWPLEGDAE